MCPECVRTVVLRRIRARVLVVACPCEYASKVLSGMRILSGSERAEEPASVRLGAMSVFKLAWAFVVYRGLRLVHFLCTV